MTEEKIKLKTFKFTEGNLQKAKKEIEKYPFERKRSAVKSILKLAQKQNKGYLSVEAMDYVAKMLDMPYIRVYEVATFYTMFNTNPIGSFHIQLCGTTPCWLRGSDNLHKACQQKLGITYNQTTKDNLFTLTEVECIGGCANAPVVRINDDYYEDLNKENFTQLLDDLAKGKNIKTGSQISRKCSAPKDGLTTLKKG